MSRCRWVLELFKQRLRECLFMYYTWVGWRMSSRYVRGRIRLVLRTNWLRSKWLVLGLYEYCLWKRSCPWNVQWYRGLEQLFLNWVLYRVGYIRRALRPQHSISE